MPENQRRQKLKHAKIFILTLYRGDSYSSLVFFFLSFLFFLFFFSQSYSYGKLFAKYKIYKSIFIFARIVVAVVFIIIFQCLANMGELFKKIKKKNLKKKRKNMKKKSA